MIDHIRQQIELPTQVVVLTRSAWRSSPARPSGSSGHSPRSLPRAREGELAGNGDRSGQKSTAPGCVRDGHARRDAVLKALADGEAITAGEVAAKTGLARGTVSATLSRLTQAGQLQRAERGYRLAPASR